MRVKVKALKKFGRYAPGDEFEESEIDANILTLLKMVERVADDAPTFERRPRRAYKRRDLTAEE